MRESVMKGKKFYYRKNTKSFKGLTLVETIICIALIGLIATALLPIFGSGFKMIVRNGKTINSIYGNQNAMENKISDGASSTSDVITVTFPSSGKTVTVNGEKVIDGSFEMFIPNK